MLYMSYQSHQLMFSFQKIGTVTILTSRPIARSLREQIILTLLENIYIYIYINIDFNLEKKLK